MRRIACSKVKHSEHSRPQTCLQGFTILSHPLAEVCDEISSVEQRRSGDSVAALLLQAPIIGITSATAVGLFDGALGG